MNQAEQIDPRDMNVEQLEGYIASLVAEKTTGRKPEPDVQVTRVDVATCPKGYGVDGRQAACAPDADAPSEIVRFYWAGTYTTRSGELAALNPMHGFRIPNPAGGVFEFDVLPGVSWFPAELWDALDLSSERIGSLGRLISDGHATFAREGQKLRIAPLTKQAQHAICNRISRTYDAETNEIHGKLYPVGHEVRTSTFKKVDFIREQAAKAARR